MGYDTYYTLTVDDRGDEIWKFITDVRQGLKQIDELPASESSDFCWLFTEYANGEFFADTCGGWSDCDRDMTELSKAFPDVTFTLEGHGEGASDIWIHEYLDNNITSYHLEYMRDDLKINREPAFESHAEKLSDICLRALANNPVLINYSAIPSELWERLTVKIIEENFTRLCSGGNQFA
jgi:hypothetical protein